MHQTTKLRFQGPFCIIHVDIQCMSEICRAEVGYEVAARDHLWRNSLCKVWTPKYRWLPSIKCIITINISVQLNPSCSEEEIELRYLWGCIQESWIYELNGINRKKVLWISNPPIQEHLSPWIFPPDGKYQSQRSALGMWDKWDNYALKHALRLLIKGIFPSPGQEMCVG